MPGLHYTVLIKGEESINVMMPHYYADCIQNAVCGAHSTFQLIGVCSSANMWHNMLAHESTNLNEANNNI